jgi:G3E family GTPase
MADVGNSRPALKPLDSLIVDVMTDNVSDTYVSKTLFAVSEFAKGLLSLAETEKRYVFHLVAKRFSLDEWPPDGPATNKLVLIGRNLDRAQLRRALEACLVPT